MMRWVLAGLAFVAQGDSGAAETQRFASIPDIVNTIAAAARKDGTLVIWLVDSASGAQGTAVADLFSQSVARSFHGSKATHAVVAFGKVPKPRVNGSADLKAVAEAIRAVAATPPADGEVINCLHNVRAAVSAYAAASTSRKILVLFTQLNGDNEDDVEGTLAILKRHGVTFFAIAPEALTSDTYWKRHAPEPTSKAAAAGPPLLLRGQESAFIEFPWGWPLGLPDAAPEAPSGYGYWALTRLAAVTGGRYAIWSEDGEGESFCRKHACVLCEGQHAACGAAYDEFKIKLLRPDLGSRADVLSRGSRDPLALAIAQTWSKLQEARQLEGPPELAVRAGQLASNEKARPQDALVLRQLLESVKGRPGRKDWEQLRLAALKQVRELQLETAELAAVIKIAGGAASRRSAGLADALLVHLKLLIHAYTQLTAFAEELERGPKAGGAAIGGLNLIQPPGKELEGITAHTYFLCHGGEALKAVKFLGDLKELHADLEFADRMIEKHRGTPWELVIRRASLPAYALAFKELELGGGGGGGDGKKDKKPKSKAEETPTEGGGSAERPEVRTLRSGRSTGAGTATGGGK